MIDENFKKMVESNMGCVVLMAGSGSDDKPKNGGKSHIEKIVDSYEDYGIPYAVRIFSAHKEPVETKEAVKEYDALDGALAYTIVAGGTDALSGGVSFMTHRLVISCPPDAPNESCTTNPPGSSNVYVPNPKNVGRAVAQAFSHLNPKYKRRLVESIEAKVDSLKQDDVKINAKYAGRRDRLLEAE